MDVVKDYFKKEFRGCSLKKLNYDEEFSQSRSDAWAEQYGAEQAIVLTSTFYVSLFGGDGSLNPNSIYDNWQWVLTRDRGGEWELRTWGYG